MNYITENLILKSYNNYKRERDHFHFKITLFLTDNNNFKIINIFDIYFVKVISFIFLTFNKKNIIFFTKFNIEVVYI